MRCGRLIYQCGSIRVVSRLILIGDPDPRIDQKQVNWISESSFRRIRQNSTWLGLAQPTCSSFEPGGLFITLTRVTHATASIVLEPGQMRDFAASINCWDPKRHLSQTWNFIFSLLHWYMESWNRTCLDQRTHRMRHKR